MHKGIFMQKLVLHLFFMTVLLPFSTFAQEEVTSTPLDQEYLHPEAALIITGVASGSFHAMDIPENPMERFGEIGISIPLQIRQQLEEEPSSIPWTSVGAFSFLITQLYDIPGGILYNFIPSAHYATKELQHLGLLPPDIHPRQPISAVFASELLEEIDLMLEKGAIR